ncbi:carbohydrate kinase [Rhodocytophaga rosea]|uniref:Carbohydrate kinase n=1 Tax=Rhodocytophaga rosea TaxID=2704465 RepID=A0A6C0GLH5_9BACT|nr:carbohydrate kinase [Rhodocytophaga rosea]QHT68931.1 carbohydrate kinase [Rhodocytophaga rosea]
MNKKIICFGETLWDMLPDGAMPGGAPMNVAIHLHYQGYTPTILSRIGNDAAGKNLLSFLQEKGISTGYIQADETHQTGLVQADISNKTHVTYNIVALVAWDYIRYEEQAARLVQESDVFIYGSLASRSKTTCETLFKYLPLASLKVFDVNLRPPHYSPKQIQLLMDHASIIKMNHHELTEILSWYGQILPEKEGMEYLIQRFHTDVLLVTRGENGASVFTSAGYFEHPGFQVKVEDTIGSGDAFLAVFLHQYLSGMAISQILPFACAVGAYVATQRGATPVVPENAIRQLLDSALASNPIIL